MKDMLYRCMLGDERGREEYTVCEERSLERKDILYVRRIKVKIALCSMQFCHSVGNRAGSGQRLHCICAASRFSANFLELRGPGHPKTAS